MSQAIAAAKLFQARDLFVHDGSHLRRLRLSAPVQMAMLIAMVLLLTWSAYSAFRLFLVPTPQAAAPAAVSSDIARLAAATEARVQQIEQRQQILAAMIAGAEGRSGSDRQARLHRGAVGRNGAQGGPFDSASQSDPTFKSLFTSWKKLDNLADGAIAVPSDKPVKTAEFTSGYGIRSDPVPRRRRPCMPGIDLAAPDRHADLRHRRRHRQRGRLQQRRLRQPHQGRPWPRHRDPLRPPVAHPGQRRASASRAAS